MIIKRTIDFLDWLIKNELATKTVNGIQLKTLTTEQLKTLKNEYKHGTPSERLDFQKSKYVRQK
jgi:hypothetical protein